MDPLPLSALNDYLYCERRAHMKFVDGLRGTNEHTLIGDLAHAAVDICLLVASAVVPLFGAGRGLKQVRKVSVNRSESSSRSSERDAD